MPNCDRTVQVLWRILAFEAMVTLRMSFHVEASCPENTVDFLSQPCCHQVEHTKLCLGAQVWWWCQLQSTASCNQVEHTKLFWGAQVWWWCQLQSTAINHWTLLCVSNWCISHFGTVGAFMPIGTSWQFALSKNILKVLLPSNDYRLKEAHICSSLGITVWGKYGFW